MTTVILAEKPSQAEAYAKCFQKQKKENGYYLVEDSILNDRTIVTYGYGHLVSLAEPKDYKEEWGNWDLTILPIFPSNFKFVVPKDKSKQFSIVKKLLKEATTIVIATDCDREGENIAWSIINKAGANTADKQFKRLWVNSMEKDVLRKGFSTLKNGKEYLPYYEEAEARQIADWLIGMNASLLFTLLLQGKGIQGVYSIGRVQTPTLYMIYERQRANETFVKEPFWEINATVTQKEQKLFPVLEPYQRFSRKEEAQNFLTTHGVTEKKVNGTVEKVNQESKETESPKLHSLSSLQKKMNKSYKATAKQTLDAAQALYDAKLVSYPRTQCQFITESEFSYLKIHISEYQKMIKNVSSIEQTEPRRRYVDAKKVKEHYALIPTKRVATEQELNKLSELQKNIYYEILKTTAGMFLPNYKFDEQEILINVSSLTFKLVTKTMTDFGWKCLYESEKAESSNRLLFEIGQSVPLTLKLDEKETTPPELFTEGTLLTAMIQAGKLVDDETEKETLNATKGIGTEATRADIIETIKKRGYVEIKKNKFIVTPKGQILCKAVKEVALLTSPEMTAKWELYLEKIGKQQGNPSLFIENIKKFITHLISTLPKQISELDIQSETKEMEEKEIVGTCPKCKKEQVKVFSKLCKCTDETCGFVLWKNIAGKTLSLTVMKELLSKGQSAKKIKGFKGKKSSFDAYLKLDDDFKITFDFDRK